MSMEEEDKTRYETLFYCQKLENGFLSGDAARALFIKSKLPLLDLTRIWKLSDVTHDNKLDVFEFSFAMHLIEMKLCGQEIPKELDLSDLARDKKDVIIAPISKDEKHLLKEIFDHKDTNNKGYLESNVVRPMLLASGLPPSVLTKIWNIADLDRDENLSLLEFYIAFHLVKTCMKGTRLDGAVNPFLCLPEEETAAHFYKEKMKIFDKEFLLEQKLKKTNSDLFSKSCHPNDNDIELLSKYLPSSITVLNNGETGSKDIDDNFNSRYFDRKPVLDHDAEIYRKNSDFGENTQQSTGDVDKISRHGLSSSDLTIDLEGIFEMVDKETPHNYEEGPKYVARVSAGDEIAPEGDDMMTAQPFVAKRTYAGKPLIFEDPIGCETIGDVEVEVDFVSIINDIERESVDEERRLPIARVLPIYKSLPNTSELPFENTVTNNGDGEVDWDLKDDYNVRVGRMDIENTSVEGSGSEIISDPVISMGVKGSVIINGTTGDHNRIVSVNNASQDENAKGKDSGQASDDAVVLDIVEQKRIIMQNQLEERRRFKATKEERGSNDNDKEYWRKKDRETRGNNNVFEKKEIGITDIQSIPKTNSIDNSISCDETKNHERTVSQIDSTRAERIVSTSITINVNNINQVSKTGKKDESKRVAVDEEEQRREAKRREEILLERIKFLEEKRKQLVDQKEQELQSKSVMHNKVKELDNVPFVSEQMQSMSSVQNSKTIKTTQNGAKNVRNHDNSVKQMKTATFAETDSIDIWPEVPNEFGKRNACNGSRSNEAERKRLALAVEAKRKAEAELEKRREAELREAEKRRLEEMAKEQEEREGAEERKRKFLENLEKLKERVVAKDTKTSVPDARSNDGHQRKTTKEKTSSVIPQHSGKKYLVEQTSSSAKGIEDKFSDRSGVNNEQKNIKEVDTGRAEKSFRHPLLTDKSVSEVSRHFDPSCRRDEELQLPEEQIRRENFKSNMGLFKEKVQTENEENADIVRGRKITKERPKSYHAGMFNKSLHQIVDDSLLSRDFSVNPQRTSDLVDEEALKQFEREQELKSERERLSKIRHTLERETSYTVDNVEKMWGIDTNQESRTDEHLDSTGMEVKPSSNAHRRSLVNTLTTEWNSFLDQLEQKKRKESETVKMRQEISVQRKSSRRNEKAIKIDRPPSNGGKSDPPKDVIHVDQINEQSVENDMEVLAKQSGKVRQMVNSYKRLSAPNLLQQDVLWSFHQLPNKTEEDTQKLTYPANKGRLSPKGNAASVSAETDSRKQNQLKRQEQLDTDNVFGIESTPKRKTDLAHAWSDLVSRQ